MKTRILTVTAAIILMGTSSVLHAQTVVINPEQEVVIQKYVTEPHPHFGGCAER